MHPEYVLLGTEAGNEHLLLFHGAAYGADAVPQPRGFLVVLLLSTDIHLRIEPGQQFPVAAHEKQPYLIDHLAVRLGVHRASAGGHAPVELKIDARAVGASAVQLHLGSAQFEDAMEHLQGLARQLDRGIGPIIFGVLFQLFPYQKQARVKLVDGEFEEGVGLIVLEVDIVAGLIFLDQVGFQEQRFAFVSGLEDLDIPHQVDHGGDVRGMAG